MNRRSLFWVGSLLTSASLLGCGGDDDAPSGGLPANARAAALSYAEIAGLSYADALGAAKALEADITSFVTLGFSDLFEAVKRSWRTAHATYLLTDVYRFYGGPIDTPDGGAEQLINSWPLDESYIDYVEGMPTAGIVNDPSITIDEATLSSMHGQGGANKIAIGFHAIEFLVWGQDLSATGPGERSFTDYVVGGVGTAQNRDRRGLYLKTASALLVRHLQTLADAWKADTAGNYRAAFEAEAPKDQLTKMLTGYYLLARRDAGVVRLQAALASGDQEHEQSSFSDTTHDNMIQNVSGLSVVWQAAYGPPLPTSTHTQVYKVVFESNPELADRADTALVEAIEAARALHEPFDQEILMTNPEGRARVTALKAAMQAQADVTAEIFELYGLVKPAE